MFVQNSTTLPTNISALVIPPVQASKEEVLRLLETQADSHPDQAEQYMAYHDTFSQVDTNNLKDYVMKLDGELTAARQKVHATHDRADGVGRKLQFALYGGLAGVALSLGHLQGSAQVAGIIGSVAPFVLGFVAQRVIEAQAQKQWREVDEVQSRLFNLKDAAEKVNELYPDFAKVSALQAGLNPGGDPGIAFLEDEITIGDFSLERH